MPTRELHYAKPRQTTKNGFTLIELSLVLVIIGLLAGGILVGGNLIYAATIRSQAAQLEKISQAARAFQTKYNSLPGDYPVSMSGYFLHGDGNGIINDYNNAPYPREIANEPIGFFTVLVEAGLLPPNNMVSSDGTTKLCWASLGGGIYAPSINNGAGMMATTVMGFNYIYLGITSATGCSYVGATSATSATVPDGVMNATAALALDSKIDDGVPGTGNLYASVPGSQPSCTPCIDGTVDTTANLCVTNSSATTYNTSNTQKWCRLMYKLY